MGDTSLLEHVAENIQQLCAERYSGGQNLAHKSVTLLDARLLVAIEGQLSVDDWRAMLQQECDAGQRPFELLDQRHPLSSQWAFATALPRLPSSQRAVSAPMIVHSEHSSIYGGSVWWSENMPVRVRSRVRDGNGNTYLLLALIGKPEDEVDTLCMMPSVLGNQCRVPCRGVAILLRTGTIPPHEPLLCVQFVPEAVVERNNGTFDEVCFEPAIRVSGSSRSETYKGRIAADRGIWIGGCQYFDDFVVAEGQSAAALLVFDPSTMSWWLLAAGAEVSSAGQGQAAAPEQDFGAGRLAVPWGTQTEVHISAGGVCSTLELEPSFTSRRLPDGGAHEWGLEAARGALTLEQARNLRERLVLVQFQVDIRNSPQGPPAALIEQLGAVVSEFIIGRQSGSSLEISKAPVQQTTVSRSHCVLQLREEAGELRLFAYDDGSLAGTFIREQQLGVGSAAAVEVRQGDTLQLGPCVTVHLRRVSPVLRLDDHAGLASFFRGLGDQNVSESLLNRPSRRQTERLVSRSIVMSRRMTWDMGAI